MKIALGGLRSPVKRYSNKVEHKKKKEEGRRERGRRRRRRRRRRRGEGGGGGRGGGGGKQGEGEGRKREEKEGEGEGRSTQKGWEEQFYVACLIPFSGQNNSASVEMNSAHNFPSISGQCPKGPLCFISPR